MAGDSEGGVLEVKFPLQDVVVGRVLQWMRLNLEPDSHGLGEQADAYFVQSLYLDTADLDVFHRRGSYARAKFRIRRYGESGEVFLERKLKRDGVVRKRRLAIPSEELARLHAQANGAGWPGAWFHHRLELRQLQPVVRMTYCRVARLGHDLDGRFRVTLDRDLHAALPAGFAVPCALPGDDLLRGGAVMEVKFRRALPSAVKILAEELHLAIGPLSKYRTGVRSCGLVPDEPSSLEEAMGAPDPADGAHPFHA